MKFSLLLVLLLTTCQSYPEIDIHVREVTIHDIASQIAQQASKTVAVSKAPSRLYSLSYHGPVNHLLDQICGNEECNWTYTEDVYIIDFSQDITGVTVK